MLLHIEVDPASYDWREAAVIDIVARYIPLKEDEEFADVVHFLVEKLHLPKSILHKSMVPNPLQHATGQRAANTTRTLFVTRLRRQHMAVTCFNKQII